MAVLGLDQVGKTQIDLAGGKGANLGELISLGFPIPPGFVVGADSYTEFMSEFEIPANDEITDGDVFLSTLRDQILAKNITGDLHAEIESHHKALASGRTEAIVYAVRSSATAEDMADASFAGQHETYYYVDHDNILLMIKKCWASLWSEEAFSYRESQGIEHRNVHMAVVVQEMVRSDVSGVTFTADPVSGADNVIITESSWGMGAAIVDGRVSPDQYVVDKKSQRLTSIKISDKKFMVPNALTPEQQSRLVEVPATLRRAESLTDDQVDQITAWAVKAEEHFGGHQDIEWAISGGELYLLQSRPVTVMGSQEEEPPKGKYILFKPIAENFTDPLMPLTQDIVDGLVPSMKIIHGRLYMNFDHIRGLIPLKLSDSDVARLAYLSDPEEEKPRISIPRILVLLVILYINYLIMGVFYRRTASLPDDFMQSFRGYFEKVVNDSRIDAAGALIHLFMRFRFFEPAGNMVLLVNLVAPRYMLLLRMTSMLLERWTPDLPQDTASLLCSGSEGVLSTEMGREILDLARIAKSSALVTETIQSEEPKDALIKLREDSEGVRFCEALDAFLAKHGHRALKEFELSSVRWEEDPSPVVGMVRNYLLVDTNLEDTEAHVIQHREELWAEVSEKLGQLPLEGLGQPRFRLLRYMVDRAKYYMKLRENSRFYHIMGFYAVRKKVLQLETSLLHRGALKCKDDIFYLYWNEIKDLDEGITGWTDVEDIIRARRMEHIRLTKMVPPKTIGIPFDEDVAEGTDSLSGQGAAPGRYEGTARVIMDPASDNEIKPGEILVAPYTDPAWTPLFLTANAAVIEVGSYLSHAGTIAREYGMPCVVDVSNCTSKIQTGERIVVDGTHGAVTILGDAEVEEEEALS